MRKTPLDREQQRIVATIARERGFTCSFCQSTEARSTPHAEPNMGGSANIVVKCAKCGDGTAVVELTAEEARRCVSINHDRHTRSSPETDGIGRTPRA